MSIENTLAKAEHSFTAAEALSVLLGIRYASNKVFEKLKKQDSAIFHSQVKLTSSDLYVSIVDCGDARLALSATKIFGCTSIVYEMQKDVRDFNINMIEKERLEHSMQCFPLDNKNVEFLRDKLQKFCSLGSNLVVHICLTNRDILESFSTSIENVLNAGGRVITQGPLHFEMIAPTFLCCETVLYKFYGTNSLGRDCLGSESIRQRCIPNWRAHTRSSKFSFADLHRLCQVELMTVTKFLQNESNKPPEEFDGHNDLNSIYHSYLKRKVYLEKDLNAFKISQQVLGNNMGGHYANIKGFTRTSVVLNHLQMYSAPSGNSECEFAYRKFIAFRNIMEAYNVDNSGPVIVNTPAKPISHRVYDLINKRAENSPGKSINIFSSSYNNPNLITLEDVMANNTIALIDRIIQKTGINGIVINPPNSPVLRSLKMKKSWSYYCTDVVSQYAQNQYGQKVERVLIIHLHYKSFLDLQENVCMDGGNASVLHINISRGKNASSAENFVNIPLSSDTQTAGDYLHLWDTIVMPKARNFDPDIILFDTISGSVTGEYLAHLIYPLQGLANGNIVLFLEQSEVENHVDEDIELMAACKNFMSVLRVLQGWPPQRLRSYRQTSTASTVNAVLEEKKLHNDKFIVSDREDVSAKQGDKGDMNEIEDHAHHDLLRHGSEIELEDEAHV